MRVRRGGRGVGIMLSLAVVVVYYLVSLLGESMARTGALSAVVGQWMATALILLLSLILLRFDRMPRFEWASRFSRKKQTDFKHPRAAQEHTLGAGGSGFPSLLDTSLFRTLSMSFLAGLRRFGFDFHHLHTL